MTMLSAVLFGVVAALGAGCTGPTERQDSSVATGEICEPEPSETAGIADVAEGRRGEALVEHLTGIDELVLNESQEGVEIIYDQPNYGGVWGDCEGGWIVAVLDCTQVDIDEIARIAGGPNAVRVIEVPHGFEQVNVFRDALVAELHSSGIPGDVPIDSTRTGRHIRVTVEDLEQIPDDFGRDVPSGIFSIEQGPLTEPAG